MTSNLPHRLARILEYKKDEVAALRRERSLDDLEAAAKAADQVRPFERAILDVAQADGNALICEVKRRSPSAGDINTVRSPVDAARAYEAGGGTCVSVLTDGPSFGGSLADLVETRAAITLPVLRKDFMLDPIQIVESRAYGADAILIIMAAVSDEQAQELSQTAISHGMAVLLEAHDREELERALLLPSPLVGVNNRDLRTFTTDIATTAALAGDIPEGRVLISESGIHDAATIHELRQCGARGFLIGEAVMRASDPSALVAEFKSAGL